MSIKFIITVFSFVITSSLPTFCQTTAKDELKKAQIELKIQGKKYNWEAFDTTSNISFVNINIESIQGNWKAYNGIFKFGDIVNAMALTVPITFELKDNKSRRNKDSQFEAVTISGNQIIFKMDGDIGIINKITDNLLVITWKHDNNYTRYFYENK